MGVDGVALPLGSDDRIGVDIVTEDAGTALQFYLHRSATPFGSAMCPSTAATPQTAGEAR
jgi:hypothetical protein